MRLLCDANVGSIIARAMSQAGHDVVRAIEVTPDAEDVEVLAFAVTEQRVLVTCDRDFGELIFLHRADQPPAIIYIRFEPAEVADILPRLMPLLDFTRLEGHMTVIGVEHDRHVRFPVKSRTNG